MKTIKKLSVLTLMIILVGSGCSTVTDDKNSTTNNKNDTNNKAQISVMKINDKNSGWSNWDSDPKKDGYILQPYFEDEKGEMIKYQSLDFKQKDWSAEVTILDWNDFTDETREIDSITYTQDDIIYDSQNIPHIRINREVMSKNNNTLFEVSLSSPTYGDFTTETVVVTDPGQSPSMSIE